MEVKFPSDIKATLARWLEEGIDRDGMFMGSLNILLAFPTFASDSLLRGLVKKVLLTNAIGYRLHAATILHGIGDPDGILHITYNSLGTHPLLKQDQTKFSGWWTGYVSRYADALTDECIELLIRDMSGSHPYFHGDSLAQLPTHAIVPRMLPLLGAGGNTARYAAYVLAFKGRNDGFNILKDWLKESSFPMSPLRAISHLPDREAIDILSEYADADHSIYQGDDYSIGSSARYIILPDVQLRLAFRQSQARMPAAQMMEKYYWREVSELNVYDNSGRGTETMPLSTPINVFLLREPPKSLHPWAPNFLNEFATPEERRYCADRQRGALDQLFKTTGINFTKLLDGKLCPFMTGLHRAGLDDDAFYHMPEFRIVYDKADYFRAATEWIVEPRREIRPYTQSAR